MKYKVKLYHRTRRMVECIGFDDFLESVNYLSREVGGIQYFTGEIIDADENTVIVSMRAIR